MKKLGQVIIASASLLLAGLSQAGESLSDIYDYIYSKKPVISDGNGGNGGGGNGGAPEPGGPNGGAMGPNGGNGGNGGGMGANGGGMGANGGGMGNGGNGGGMGDNGGGPNGGGMGANGGNGGGPTAIPELDSLGAPIALALVAGIGGLAIERRRRQNKSKK